ncbi:MAG: pyrimidine reductase family protein [Nocardioidaceae bacterium]|nr:pyrimidine reductase family protein [Nocardioidaceae bacterium]
MQSLFPGSSSELSYEDLTELYDYPSHGVWVRANFVSTLDGAVQGADHKSGSLSSKADKRVLGLLRSVADVVVIGANTARVEDYQPVKSTDRRTHIRQRLGLGPGPAMAVVSRSLDVDAALLGGGTAPTLVITTESSPSDRRAQISERAPVIIAGETSVDFAKAVDLLAEQGFARILCEGGPTLMHDVVSSGRLDELCLTWTPVIASGNALRLTDGPAIKPPYQLHLKQLLEEDGELFARYARE